MSDESIEYPSSYFEKVDRRAFLQYSLMTSAGVTTLSKVSTGTAAAAPGDLRWQFTEAEKTVLEPVVSDGTVYIASDDSNLYAIDAVSGEEQWTFTTPNDGLGVPEVANGKVYCGCDDSKIYAVNKSSGDEEWIFNTSSQNFTLAVAYDGSVYIGGNSVFYALDGVSGDERWRFTESDGYGGAAVAADTVYISGKEMYAVDADSGDERWRFTAADDFIFGSEVANKTVYLSSADSNLYAVDATTGEEKWRFTAPREPVNTPVVINETVYLSSNDSNLYAIDASNGEEQWQFTTPDLFTAPPVVGDEMVYVPSGDETLYAVGARSGEEQWRFTNPNGYLSVPAFGDDTVYVAGSDSTLYAVETSAATGPSIFDGSLANQILPVLLGMIGIGGGWWLLRDNDELTDQTDRDDSEETVASERPVANGLDSFYRWRSDTSDSSSSEGSQTNDQSSKSTDTSSSGPPPNEKNTQSIEQIAEETVEATEETDDSSVIGNTNSKSMTPDAVPSSPKFSLSYDDIEKGELLGSGGNADVYKAISMTESGEVPLAIKEPRVGGATVDIDTVDMILDEAETWQQLDDHDHIVSVIDFGSTPLSWIGMEYMDGGDLGKRAGELPFEQALWTALAITKGIRYAHKRGVAHLDLKPSNILFRSVESAWDVPKVADWGLSKHLLEHSQSVEGMSPRYAAPEQLDSGQFGQTDTVTDVYQLGTVLYELFTGEPHFSGDTYEVMNKIQSATPTPPSERSDLPEEIDDILLTALETERNDRYDDVILLRNALRDVWDDYK